MTLWHRDTSQHTASDTQTEPTAGSQETFKRKARGYVVTATGGRKAEEKERKGGSLQVQSREKLSERDMLWDYTHTHIYVYIDIIRYVSELRQSSSGRERQRIEIVRSSAERITMLGEVSMLAARRNFYRKRKTQRSHVKARATVH